MPTPALRVFASFLALWLFLLAGISASNTLHVAVHDSHPSDGDQDHHEGCALCLFAHGSLDSVDVAPPGTVGVAPVIVPYRAVALVRPLFAAVLLPPGRGPPPLA